MNIPEAMLQVLKCDGVVALATLGPDGPHMVNTWNSYIRFDEAGRLLIPAGYMQQTEKNIAANPQVLLTLGSIKVPGRMGPGTGFLIKGSAEFLPSGPAFDQLKAIFGWARAAVAVTIDSVTQTL